MCHLSPPFLRAEVRGTLVKALPHLHAALVAGRADGVTAGRVWKLCLLEWNNRACKAGRYSSRGRKRSSAGVLKRHPSSTRRFYTSTDVLQYLKLQATQPLVFKRSGDTRQETCHCGAVGNECEHLKLLLQNLETLELLADTAPFLAQPCILADIVAGLAMVPPTALRQPDGFFADW